jgi:anti-sigma factor RsiW
MEALLAYAADELSAAERAELDNRLARDPQALATLKLYQSAQQALAQDDSVAPPAHAVARAKSIYVQPRRAPQTSWFERAQQLVAKLVFDSRTQPALAGVRARSQSCSLVFETEREAVDLQAEPRRDADGRVTAWQLVGQVEQDEDSYKCPVAFIRLADKSHAAETTLDERGVFSLDLMPGTYEIRIGLPNHTIIVPKLDLP